MTDRERLIINNIVDTVNRMDEFEIDVTLKALQLKMCMLQEERDKEAGRKERTCVGCPWGRNSEFCRQIGIYTEHFAAYLEDNEED